MSKRKPKNVTRTHKRFARIIVAARTTLGITREELADRIGVSPHTIANFERQTNGMSLSILELVAKELGLELQILPMRPDEFINRLEEKS